MRPTLRTPSAADLRRIISLTAPRSRDEAAVGHPLTRFSIATEWLGRLAAVLSAVLLVLVLMTIHKGLDVQHSTHTIVNNFRQTNKYFADRADLTAPARARSEITQLQAVLAQLNSATAADVDQLTAMLPDMRALVAAGQHDVNIANQLRGAATSLQGAAGALHSIASDADQSVVDVNNGMVTALGLVDQLNAELRRTTDKLAPIPAQGNVIPAPTGGN